MLSGIAACALLSGVAQAITKADNTTSLNSGSSWVGGTAPGTSDIALFDSTLAGALTVNQGGNISWGSLQLTNPGGAVTINQASGNTLTLNTSGAGIDMSAATADLTFGNTGGFVRIASGNSSPVLNVASGRTLTFNGALTNQGNTKTISLTGGGSIVFNGAAGSGGAMSFNIQSGTSVTMNGTGSWTNTSSLTSGTLNIGNDTALGASALAVTSGTVTASGGARVLTANLSFAASSGNTLTIGGSNSITFNGTLTSNANTVTVNNTAATTFGGAVNLSSSSTSRVLTVNGTGNATISGVIANGSTSTAGGLTYSGGGTLALTNANTFGGTLTATSGTVRLDNSLAAQNATVSVGTANALAFGTGITTATFGGLSGSGALALTNTDTSNVALTVGGNNTSTTYSGQLSGSGTFTKAGTGTLTLSGTNINSGTVTLAAGVLQIGSGGSTGALGSGNSVVFEGGTLTNGYSGSSTLNLGQTISVAAGQTGTLNMGNRMVLGGSVSGAGTLNINLGTTQSRDDFSNSWTGFTGTVNIAGSGTARLLNNGGGFNPLSFASATVDLGGSAFLQPSNNSGGNTYSFGALSGSSTTAGIVGPSQGGTTTLSVGALNTSTSFAGSIQGNTSLTKVGTGTLALTGSNTYTGTTTVSAGSLQVSATGSTGTGAVSVASTGTLQGSGMVRGSSFTAASGSTVHAGTGTAQGDYGTLTFTPVAGSGSFDFQIGSVVVLGINPGGIGDLLSFDGLSGGSLLFNGNLTVTAQAGFVPTSAEVFNLLDWVGVDTVTFNSRYLSSSYSGLILGNGDDNLGFDLPNLSGTGYAWDISGFTTNGTIAIVLVPEPSRALLLMLAFVAIALPRRRRLP